MDCGGTAAHSRFWSVLALGVGLLLLAGCASSHSGKTSSRHSSNSTAVAELIAPAPNEGGYYHLGKPYMVAGRTYVPAVNPHYSAVGLASWYGPDFHGRHTANGETFDQNAVSAAHPTLPLPSYVRVTNLGNRKSLVVRVNDRGPFAGNRIIDLSRKAAQILGFYSQGLAKVKVEYVGGAPLKSEAHDMTPPAPNPRVAVTTAAAAPLRHGRKIDSARQEAAANLGEAALAPHSVGEPTPLDSGE